MAGKRRVKMYDEAEAAPDPAVMNSDQLSPEKPVLPIPDVERRNATAPKRYSVAARNHVSFYLPKEMQTAAARVALDRGRKANDLYLEGLRRVLEDAGYTSDQLGLPKG